MADTKILQALIDGQAVIREALRNLEKKMELGFKRIDERFECVERRVKKLEARFVAA